MKRRISFWILVGSLIGFQTIAAQTDTTELYSVTDTVSDFGLFTNEEILELSLRFDITKYQRKKPKDEYLDAVLTYHISKTDSINKDVRLKSRGEFRNGYCNFPPIALNFKKTDFGKKDLDKIGKIKLVTHCESHNEENLFKEYLVYKLFNVLTDTSFRVRLVKINYINTSKETRPIRTYAFFIEPLDLLAERIGSIPVDLNSLNQANILPSYMDRMAIFFYMIGNSDWSVPNQHNCKILAQPSSARPDLGIVIPYDFDYTGFVNAGYAVPPEGLGIESVRERIYLGICRNEEQYLNALQEFIDKKEAFYEVINEFSLLGESSKKDLVRFMDGFYREIEGNAILRNFSKNCKKL